MWIIAGLGNPGRRYEKTRHNVGFEVLDELCRRHMQGGFRTKFGAEAVTGRMGGTDVLLLKPMEFMNKSGFALQRAAQFHNADPEHILVIHDELDLPPARLKLKSGGGHGGNNGLRSIIEQLGNRDFLRIRVGIGKPAAGGEEGSGADHVLSPFSSREIPEMQDAINKAADAAEAIVASGMTVAMNDFNGVNPN